MSILTEDEKTILNKINSLTELISKNDASPYSPDGINHELKKARGDLRRKLNDLILKRTGKPFYENGPL